MAYQRKDGEQTQDGVINKPPKLTPVTGRNHAQGYGQNQWDGGSSDVDLKNATISPLGAALKAAQDDGTHTLDAVIQHGTSAVVGESGMAHIGDVQERLVKPTAFPTTFGHKNPNANPVQVPGSIPSGLEPSKPVRQPV